MRSLTRRVTASAFAVAGMFSHSLMSAAAESGQPTRVYLANDDHTDYLWTADADTYAKVFVDLLDFHLHLADETASNPTPYRARFNTDGNFWLWNYERKKTPAEFDRLMARVKDGTIGSPLNTLVSCYGAQPLEAVLRGLYYAGRLERRYDLRFTLANATENQTLPLGLASVFAGAGARYTWRGVCGCATQMEARELQARPHEIYWYRGHDGKQLLMKWYSSGPNGIGGYLEADNPDAALRFVQSDSGFLRRYTDPSQTKPYSIVGLFGFGGDDLERKTGVTPPPEIPAVPGLQYVRSSPFVAHFHDIARASTTPQRQVIVSNEADFFADFEQRYGSNLPTESVTYGNEWDLYSASMSETSARVKRAVEQLRASELLATLVSLHYPRFMDNHRGARDDAFTALGLFWEHDWTADGPVSRGQRASWEEMTAATIEYYVRSLYAEGVIRLGGMIPRPAKANRFFVLNPLGWSRTEAADFDYRGSTEIHVCDLATGRDVPHQIVNLSGAVRLRILASDVPAAGYKVFEIRPGAAAAVTSEAKATADPTTGTMENAFVRVVVNPDGSLRSLIDRRRGEAELAGPVGGLYLNALGTSDGATTRLRVENAGPVSITLRAESEVGLPHVSHITLFRDSDRVELRNEITANFSDNRYWSFGFSLPNPSVHTEEVGSINLNKRHSDGGDYADTHARYDHVTVNHFADITAGDDARGVTISNPDLAFARLGKSDHRLLDVLTPQINYLAGGQVDGRNLGIQNQNGCTFFLQRFALQAHGKYDAVAAMRFSLEHQNPLVTGAVIGGTTGPFPEAQYSLVSISNPSVLLWALKPAEDGIAQGVVARLWNVGEQPAAATLSLTTGIARAQRTTHIETDVSAMNIDAAGNVPVTLARQEIATFRLTPAKP